MDSSGNRLFLDDLGGYTKTGEFVGCYMYPYTSPYIDSSSNNLRCRLIKSEVVGEPVIVEVLNYRAFSSSQYRMKVRMARIYNPTRAVISVPISVRIDHVQVSTNNVNELYYDTFDLFMNSQDPAPLGNNTVSCSLHTSTFTNPGYEVSGMQWMRFYPHRKDPSGYYFYVIKMPSDYKPRNMEQNNPSCTGHDECMPFPDISYMVVYTSVNSTAAYFYTTYPDAVSQNSFNVEALVWQGGRYRGTEFITINTVCQYCFRGTLVNYWGASTVENG